MENQINLLIETNLIVFPFNNAIRYFQYITTKKNVLNTFILASILSSVGIGIEIKDLDFVLEGGLAEIFDSNYKYLFDEILEENPIYNKKRRIHFLLNDDDIEVDIIKFMSFVNDKLIPVAPRIYKRKVKRKEEILW